MADGGAPETPLTWPSVISFLQHEYRRFELERSEHQLEVASLKLRISSLSIERAQQEKHKLDLQKRIKMLEQVLDSERKRNGGSSSGQSGAEGASPSPIVTSSSSISGVSSNGTDLKSLPLVSSDLNAAKRKSVLKAYLERFERLETLFVLPDLPPLSIPVPVPEMLSVPSVEDMPRSTVREVVFSAIPSTPNKMGSGRRLEATEGKQVDSPSTPPSSPSSTPTSPATARLMDSGKLAGSGGGEAAEYRKWTLRGSLRGHLDEVTHVGWHPSLPILVSASADCTLKCWNIAPIYRKGEKMARTEDFDTMHTYRGHTDQVLSAAFTNENNCILSGGADSLVMVWAMPPVPVPEDAPYLQRGAGINYLKKKLEGHTDAVWDIAAHPSASICISASADGSVKVWKYLDAKPLVSSLMHPQSKLGRHTPTSVEVMKTDNRKLLVGYSSGTIVVFDMVAEKVLSRISENPQAAHDPERQVNEVVSHFESKSLIFSAHEDKTVKYWDVNSGRCAYTLNAHEDAVTSLAIDPHSARHFATVSHDSSLRFWNLATRTCMQEIPSVGLRKSDMALHSVSFSSFKMPLAAVACADSTVKLYN